MTHSESVGSIGGGIVTKNEQESSESSSVSIGDVEGGIHGSTIAGRDAHVTHRTVNTGGGQYIEGNVHTGGGDFVGRDQVTYGAGADLAAIGRAFEALQEALEKVPEGPKKTMATQAVEGLKAEAEKGEDADEENVRQWFESLALMLPDMGEVAVKTFLNPVYGLATAFQKIAQKAKEGREG
jgi:hypothetical protein